MNTRTHQDPVLGHYAHLEDIFTHTSFEVDRSPGFYFLGGLPGSINLRTRKALYVRPTELARITTQKQCCNGKIGSFRAVRSDYWEKLGLLPIWCNDAYQIAHFLLATVPADTYHTFAER